MTTKTNLQCVSGPDPKRARRPPSTPTDGVGIVKKALYKFCKAEEIEIITSYRRSFIDGNGIKEDFLEADYPEFKFNADDPNFVRACEIVSSNMLPNYKWRPVHHHDLRYYPFTLNTSVEAPFTDDENLKERVRTAYELGHLGDARMSFHNCYNDVFVRTSSEVHTIKETMHPGDKFFYYATAHARSHLVKRDEPDKVRMVWGIPKLLIFVELMFMWAYFNFLRLGTTWLAWGFESLEGGRMRMLHRVTTHKRKLLTFIGLDFSKFDKRVLFAIITIIHNIWKDSIDFENGYIPTKEYPNSKPGYDSWRMLNLWRWMTNAVKHIPVKLPDGSFWKRRFCTLPSGLLTTQVLDSWYNAIMCITILLDMGYEVSAETLAWFLGDDSFICLFERIDPDDHERFLDEFAEIALRKFNAVLSVKKSVISNDMESVPFLGYTSLYGMPVRDEYQLLAQLLYPERSWNIDKLAARAVGIAYAGCGQYKLVYDVCRDVYEFCISVGAKPDPSGIFWLSELSQRETIPLDSFPSFLETSKKLISFSENIGFSDRFWNSEHFMDIS